MAFYGNSFIFNSVPSELYGLFIRNIDASGINSSMGSSSMEIMEKKIFRRSSPYLLGMTAGPKLTFEFSAFAEEELDADQFSLVQKWLFSPRQYCRFAIDQIDMQSVYFNAIFNDPKIERVGNLIQGFSSTVECDSPFAYAYPQTTTYTYTASSVDSTEIYYNGSDDTGAYLTPKLIITMNDFNGDISIINVEDNNRLFEFTSLLADEVLTINCGLQTISSSTGLKRLSHFNKNFLRLVPGKNTLQISGNVASISMENTWIVKKIGG